jgi:hypothetical protein
MASSVDRVIVPTAQLPSLKTLKRSGVGDHANIVVLVDIGRHGRLNKSRWRSAIAEALADPRLDLAVSPSGRHGSRALGDYLALLKDDNVAPPPPPPPLTNANLWVSTSGGSCTRQATRGLYVAAQACGSFAAAYTAAASGDLVGVKAGSYPAQLFAGGYDASQGKGSKTITFRGESGSVIHQLHSGSPNITYDGLDVDCNGIKPPELGACFENGDGANDSFINGRIGNIADEKGALVSGSNFRFDNVVLHDVTLKTSGVHNECVYAMDAPGMTVTNSTFQNCVTFDLAFTSCTWCSPLPPAYGNITLIGNTFWHSTCNGCSGVPAGWHYYGLQIGTVNAANPDGALTGWTIKNNSMEQKVGGLGTSRATPGSVICGNTGAAPSSWRKAC